ncbi:sigma-54 interaction domain-containing protein [Flavilitoribacter nigricans]|uniref:Sigma-54-dependent Fis family transcriptional regulator n=1 Tax=Flavilitoribacter nigricans (strain ATCC 23147 / DSM 23189 / NBRC 102662 / NCIMB 1420 / SS-2) TaxID=1122177 RepID=A0A2D0MZM7_FLAN2|nr:sigma-54 dependent transcriptional regulator [Flavilitoribacter nigricans]PHN01349.1 sigma-54-dependent Fis family transcriptional regulator [Flavilitoribacter nigricans DSM 23189 = NBRC 102662]
MENLRSIKQRYGIIGRSESLDRALSTALRVANTDLSVLIQGESGVGKEIFSRIIHDNSPRKHNKFIAINCGAIPEGTINSELFGHEKGAFTGATGERKGYFESYDGGTIFLDEIGEMPMDTQAFLLRVLESGEFIRVGSNKVQKTDVRIIAATNVDLQDRIKKNKFREDLYFRLNTVPIFLPALRDRREDIYMLIRKFALDFAEKYRTEPIQLDSSARSVLENYSWPGNIRELKNVVEQLSVLVEDREINGEKLVQYIPNLTSRHLPALANGSSEQELQEREILYKLLFDMKGDLNDLKSLVYGLIKNNDLQVPSNTSSMRGLRALNPGSIDSNVFTSDHSHYPEVDSAEALKEELEHHHQPIILGTQKKQEVFDDMEEVEENLSLEDHEKDLISKALKKHNGRRKEAAKDLGISERTLYRKIKQYEL